MSSGHGPPCSPASEPNRSFCSQSGSSAASDRPVCSSVTLSVLDAETRVTRDISSLERSSWCRGRVSICFHAERDECPRVDSHRDPLSDTQTGILPPLNLTKALTIIPHERRFSAFMPQTCQSAAFAPAEGGSRRRARAGPRVVLWGPKCYKK